MADELENLTGTVENITYRRGGNVRREVLFL